MPRPLPVSAALLFALLAAAAGVPFAFAQEPAATPAATADCPATTPAENEALARRWYDEVINGRDLDLLDELLAGDAVHDSATFPAGQDAAGTKGVLGTLLAGFPDVRHTVDDAVAEGDLVALRWTATGTHDGEFQGHAATGREATWTGINLYRFECGKIAQVWSETDGLGRLQQLGIAPEPAIWAVTVGTSLGDEATPDSQSIRAATAVAGDDRASPVAGGCPTTGPVENEALVRRWWDEAWSGGNVDVLDGLLADGHVHHWATGPDTTGVDEVAERILMWRAMMPDLRIRAEEIVVAGDRVAARWALSGTPASMRAPAAGQPIEVGGINIFRIECGRVAEIWSEMDALGLYEGLGLPTAATPVP